MSEDKYIFFYDESEHSRSITKETINARNFANNFVVAIIGYKFNDSQNIETQYIKLEESYKKFFNVDELKSTIIKKSKYIHGLKSIKDNDLSLVSDVFKFANEVNLQLYISVQNKIEYVINQMLCDYDNDLFVDADSMRYSVSKLINMYMPQNVIEAIYINDGSFIAELTNFLKSLLDLNKNNPNKINENPAIEQLLILLETYDKDFVINWNYKFSFAGFNLFLKERRIKDLSLVIDKEGNGNTLESAKFESFIDAVDVDSNSCVGVRIADMIAGVVSRFIVSLHNSLSYKDINDGRNLKFLGEEWFDIDKKRFDCYKLIKKVIIDLNISWYKTYCSQYSDDFLYFIALLNYFDSFQSYEEFKKMPIEDHPFRLNGGAIEMLKERLTIIQSKLKIDPIDVNPKESEYYYNQRGAKCFFDYNKQEELKISSTGNRYLVLSVGFFGNMEKACVTIDDKGKPVCYLLPDGLKEWAITCVAMANRGVNLFPSKVLFNKINNKYYADVE